MISSRPPSNECRTTALSSRDETAPPPCRRHPYLPVTETASTDWLSPSAIQIPAPPTGHQLVSRYDRHRQQASSISSNPCAAGIHRDTPTFTPCSAYYAASWITQLDRPQLVWGGSQAARHHGRFQAVAQQPPRNLEAKALSNHHRSRQYHHSIPPPRHHLQAKSSVRHQPSRLYGRRRRPHHHLRRRSRRSATTSHPRHLR